MKGSAPSGPPSSPGEGDGVGEGVGTGEGVGDEGPEASATAGEAADPLGVLACRK